MKHKSRPKYSTDNSPSMGIQSVHWSRYICGTYGINYEEIHCYEIYSESLVSLVLLECLDACDTLFSSYHCFLGFQVQIIAIVTRLILCEKHEWTFPSICCPIFEQERNSRAACSDCITSFLPLPWPCPCWLDYLSTSCSAAFS